MRFSTVLTGLNDVARKEILRDFSVDSCIASTKITIRVLRNFGFEAQPIGARLVLGNRNFARLVNEKGTIPSMDEAITAGWFTKHGAWSVGIGYPNHKDGFPDGKWGGHLIAYVKRQSTLIDISAEQGNRPKQGIVMPSMLVLHDVPHGFLKDEAVLRGELNGCLIEYRRFQDESFRSAPDWIDDSRVKRAVKAICKYIDSLDGKR